MTGHQATVFVVDDHPVMRNGIVAALERHFRVVGSAGAVGEAVEGIVATVPDLVVLDVNIPFGGGKEVIRAVRARHLDPRFLAYTALTSRDDVASMFSAGVDGYITKGEGGDEMVRAVEAVLDGARPVSRDVAGFMLDIDEAVVSDAGVTRLTPREREVCERIALGDTYRECAARLGMSVKTLENHMDHVFRKLEVQSRHQLTARLIEDGFIRPGDRER